MNSIHTRIKKRREALGMSMQELADKAGASAWQTVQQWEKEGGTAPKRARLDAVAKALGTTPEVLMFGDDEERADLLNELKGISQEAVDGDSSACNSLSKDGVRVAAAFDKLLNPAQRNAVLAQLKAFGVLD